MNLKESKFFSARELESPDCTGIPASYLVKALLLKFRRRLIGRWADRRSRFVWTLNAVSDAYGPADNVRNYLDRRTIRTILAELPRTRPLRHACEVGCGYGRLIMVLSEFASHVKGFEREPHLVEIGRRLLPHVTFERVDALTLITDNTSYDLAMTCTVLQHLTDADARDACAVLKRLAPDGYVLLIEKTAAIGTTANAEDGAQFLSRARSVETYQKMMDPFRLVLVRDRVVEPTYFNPTPGKCMLFESPGRAGEPA